MTNESHVELLIQHYLTDFYKTATYIQLIASNMSNGSSNPKELMERIKLMQKYTAALYGMTNAVFFSIQEVMERENEQ